MAVPKYRNTNNPWIKVISSRYGKEHRGVIAKKDIPKDTKIIEYQGEKVTKAESDRRDELWGDKVYTFELNKKYDIDGGSGGNEAILINHTCEENCEVDVVKGKIWIVARRDINKGEELGYDYNHDLPLATEKCLCGTKSCRGMIVGKERWQAKIRRLVKKADVKQLRELGYDRNGKKMLKGRKR